MRTVVPTCEEIVVRCQGEVRTASYTRPRRRPGGRLPGDRRCRTPMFPPRRAMRQLPPPGPRFAAGIADRLHRVVDVRGGLDVDDDVARAGPGELRHVALGTLDHEVDVEQDVEVAQRLDRLGTHRHRRDEVAVHDVDVDDLGAGVDDVAHLRAQAAEVGGEYRGRDAAPHTSTSIDPEQWLQVTVAVLDMRTNVECSPQFGHTDRSSKRWRQYTQR